MAQRILLIGGNFSPEPTGIGKYNGEMIQWLSDNGYECGVITTYPYYPQWKLKEPYKNHSWYKKEIIKQPGDKSFGTITVYRCPHYIPSNPTGKTRILHDLSFFISALFQLLMLLPGKKYDVVINVSPPLMPGLLAILYKKIKNARFIYHIQDLQVDAANDLQMIRSKKLIRFLFALEKYILKHADVISSISPGMIKKIKTKIDQQIVFFPNWSDTSFFYPINDKTDLKKEFGFKNEDKVALYSGAIGEKQGLESILFAAKAFQNFSGLKFVICGSGPYKEKLEAISKEMELNNLFFLPLQPLEKFNRFLNMADMHLVIQKVNAGDLVMPSKLTNILAAGGLAIVTANQGTSLYELIDEYKMGILTEAEKQEALNNSIKIALNSNSLVIIQNARKYAEENLSVNKVMQRFLFDSSIK
ncbi:colanic acid biosynthesis glycosyltransferase WcaI [Panacibacter ginsenosidivorans]|uniref:Colanic acid biosynthesis glycosyltransferase WcaI n=1 Tax=Panacibacter ginsenosidivorans TaxID=1813871 RepID=A0A5B8VD75_9BACT|nr:WcaI family glycosyltransferase [Panacibacter ginsenosidivorans]QEC68596.1 colanic acid biosynthesis glycosyltransferase WcaI [Panacibacter ginsenosidivorans]